MPIRKTEKQRVRYTMPIATRARGVTVDCGVCTVETVAGTRRIDALVIGEWAIHPSCAGGDWRFSGEWDGLSITHCPTGLGLGQIVYGIAMYEALLITRALQAIPSGSLTATSNPREWEWIMEAIVAATLGEKR